MIRLSSAVLIIVDAQQGFSPLCPDELPVPGALKIVSKINKLLKYHWARVDASLDWHPRDHCSFFGRRDNLYPPHCVMGTKGAEFLPGLRTERIHAIWRKGYQSDRDAYSLTEQHPGYVDLLRCENIRTAIVCGLTTNICCFHTAKDLRQARFQVYLVEDASAAVEVEVPELTLDHTKSTAMKAGIRYVRTAELVEQLG